MEKSTATDLAGSASCPGPSHALLLDFLLHVFAKNYLLRSIVFHAIPQVACAKFRGIAYFLLVLYLLFYSYIHIILTFLAYGINAVVY